MDLLNDPRAYRAQQAARRATTATSILDLAAWIGMFASVLFWNNFFFTLTAPAGIIDALLALAIAAGYAVVLPMLISLLAPSTPAGMALAETRWRTIGHVIAVAATVYMAVHAFYVLWAWWQSRPAVAQAGQDIFLAVGSLIIFVVVPALSWVQIAPDRWAAEVIQAQQVRRLRAAQQANIMAAQLQYARAMALLKRGLANATAAERQELAGTLVAMQRAENEAIVQVADSMRLLTGIDTGVRLLDDPQIEEHFHALTGQVERLFAPINEADYAELPPAPPARQAAPPAAAAAEVREYADARGWHQDAAPAPPPPAAAAAETDASAASRSDSRRLAAEFRAVAAAVPPTAVFTAKMVAGIVNKSERTARDYLTVWLDAGWIARGEAPNSYYITERQASEH